MLKNILTEFGGPDSMAIGTGMQTRTAVTNANPNKNQIIELKEQKSFSNCKMKS